MIATYPGDSVLGGNRLEGIPLWHSAATAPDSDRQSFVLSRARVLFPVLLALALPRLHSQSDPFHVRERMSSSCAVEVYLPSLLLRMS